MIEYLRSYLDDSHGDKQDYVVSSTDVRTAMNNVFELQPNCACHCAVTQTNVRGLMFKTQTEMEAIAVKRFLKCSLS